MSEVQLRPLRDGDSAISGDLMRLLLLALTLHLGAPALAGQSTVVVCQKATVNAPVVRLGDCVFGGRAEDRFAAAHDTARQLGRGACVEDTDCAHGGASRGRTSGRRTS